MAEPFAARVTRHPLAFDPDAGAVALKQNPGLPPELRPVVAGAAGSSPYLARLIGQDAAWLADTLHGPPEPVMDALVEAAAAAEGPETAATLRALKRRVALIIALADLGGVWDLVAVTGALSRFAEAATGAALRSALAQQARRGKLPGIRAEDVEGGAGMVVFAMGKLGARELNYSSDIDLICLFDEARFDPSAEMEARAGFIAATRAMAATLGEVTRDGYVFRTDLRLRPDPASTPVCLSMAAAERYYEAEGRTWERAAYIKARPIAGSIEAGARFLKTLEPFVWRRHLDFAAIHETQDLRRRIRTHKGLHSLALEGRNIKLGPGGIREIEFFAQTRQLIAGGRDSRMRAPETVAALHALARGGWIGPGEAEALAADYAALREVEHRLQMIGDVQTHTLPNGADGFDRLARLSGVADTDAYRHWLRQRLEAVDALAEPFFAPGKPAPRPEPQLDDASRDIVARWPGYPALRSARGREIFERLRPELLTRLERATKPDEALANFDGFLRGLPAGVQLFSLFDANPSLVDLIVDISATAPGLSRYLSRHAHVLDAVLDGGFFAPWPGRAALMRLLEAALAGRDYERALDAARTWQKEWHFRVGVHLLRGHVDPGTAARQYADLAAATIPPLWARAQAEVARRHGPPPGAGGAVVAMGSLGAGALTASSDLDLLVIYDADGAQVSDGPRPISTQAWYAKATKTLVAALSAPTAAGTLYEVDMRLRPSGRQGPVATSLAAFAAYQRNEAWTWEHLALTRATPLAGPEPVTSQIETVRQAVIAASGPPERIRADTAEMRRRLRAAGRVGGTFAVKDGPGGAQDIALLAQAGALIAGSPARDTASQLGVAVTAGLITAPEAATLTGHASLFDAIRQATHLLSEGPVAPEALGVGGLAFLARTVGAAGPGTLASLSDSARAEAAAIIDGALPPPEETP